MPEMVEAPSHSEVDARLAKEGAYCTFHLLLNHPRKLNITGWNFHLINEDVFPIEHVDFPMSFVSFQG